MCDFSIRAKHTRAALVGDRLTPHEFGNITIGLKAADDNRTGVEAVAVCVMPGTELAFLDGISYRVKNTVGVIKIVKTEHKTAIFRQVNQDKKAAHHDALEFPDGRVVLLTALCFGQFATVLQLGLKPRTAYGELDIQAAADLIRRPRTSTPAPHELIEQL